MFSLISPVIEPFAEHLKNPDIQDFFKKLNTRLLWSTKVIEENDEDITIEYFKTGNFTEEEYPLINFY